jgi:hypothetical protein
MERQRLVKMSTFHDFTLRIRKIKTDAMKVPMT